MENKEEQIYKTAYIYAIKSPNTGKIYIGSTHKKLHFRFSEHKYAFEKVYYTSHEIFKEGDAYIELVKTFTNISESSLRKEEGNVIKQTPNTVNKQVAGRTVKEWFEDHAEEIKEYKKQYSIENRNKIKEYKKNHAETHKEHIAAYQNQYRELNKTKIYVCDCGSSVQHSSKRQHEKTKIHQNYLLRN
jgi:predicted ATP-dependent protease